jgi:hypothetical protein
MECRGSHAGKFSRVRTTSHLRGRETVLAEAAPEEFAAAHGFCLLPDENIAGSPGIVFQVETFTPTENFNPNKPYATRFKMARYRK